MLIFGVALLSAAAAALTAFLTGAFSSMHWLWVLPASFLGAFLVLGGLAFLFLWLMAAIVDLDKPQEKDSVLYRTIVKLYAPAAMTLLLTRVHTKGLEKTPESGRFLLVCNHINDLDPVTLLAYFPRSQLAFISKRENRDMFIVGPVMHRIQCQMINRENDREALKTILKCVSIIREDKASIAVFPEGYTSMDGLLHPFRHGVFKIAQKTKVPIVVCTLQNTNKVFKNAMKLKPTDVHLHLVGVLQPEDFESLTTVELGTQVHKMMADDLGEDLVLKETT